MPTCDAHAAATQCTWPQARGTGAGAHACDAGGGETHRGLRRRRRQTPLISRLPTPRSSGNARGLGPMAAAILPPWPPDERCDTKVAASGPANDTWKVAPGGEQTSEVFWTDAHGLGANDRCKKAPKKRQGPGRVAGVRALRGRTRADQRRRRRFCSDRWPVRVVPKGCSRLRGHQRLPSLGPSVDTRRVRASSAL